MDKGKTTLYDGMKYNSIQLMMPNSGRKSLSRRQVLFSLHNEVSVLDKQGNELDDNIKDKKVVIKQVTSMTQK